MNMLNDNFVVLAAVLNFIGSFDYAKETFKGNTKPNRVTWFLWALAPLIAFFAEIGKGVGIASLMTFMVGFGPLIVFIVSFLNKKSVWKISKLDVACGALSILGIIFWSITREANLAITFSILADLFAGVPTVIKSYRAPETESYIVFLLAAISATITLLTIKNWNFANYGFPAYILIICFILFVLIRSKLGPKIREII
jgi:hypothetical protein